MKYTRKDFHIGQEVVLEHTGNLVRRQKGYSKGVIEKIGTKNVDVRINPYTLVTMVMATGRQKTSICSDYDLHLNEEQFVANKLHEKKINQIQRAFSGYGSVPFTHEQIAQAHAILFPQETEQLDTQGEG